MSRFALPALALALLLPPPSPAADEVQKKDLRPGLLLTVKDKGGAELTRLEPTPAVTLNAGEAVHPKSDGGETFTWTGYIQVVTAGKYTFGGDLMGKFTVTVGDAKVLTHTVKGGDKAQWASGGEVDLKAGIHPFTATLERIDKKVQAELRWVGPRFVNEPVPYFFFGHMEKQRPASYAADAKRDHGRMLFEELACAKCHTTGDGKMAKGLADRTGPNLSKIAERAYPGWVDAWLADPKKLRPHTAMPGLFADTAVGKEERHAVTAYLNTLGKPVEPYKPPLVYPNDVKTSIARGAKLYLLGGCASCHGDNLTAPPSTKKKDDDPDAPEEKPFDPLASFHGVGSNPTSFYQLNHLGSKTRPEALAKYLKNPMETNPHGRMPGMGLNDTEALDLARYLCTQTDEALNPAMPAAPPTDDKKIDWVAKGRTVFAAKGCANCHAVEEGGKPVASTATPPAFDKLAKAADKGCLAEKPGEKAARFTLTADQRGALAAFVTDGLTGAGSPSPVFTAHTSFKRFNCLNCHSRDGEGGIPLVLADKMKAQESAENVDDVQPPRLTGIGHKARTSWLKDVILNGGRARPWMTLRMPQYGTANVGGLPESLPLLEGILPDDTVGKATFTKDKVDAGRALAGREGLGCVACHDISGQKGGGTRGPDLATTNQRVRNEWFTRLLHGPQRVMTGTKMPQPFIEGKSLVDKYYKGDGDQQAEALWAYFALGPGLPLPAGLEPPKGGFVVLAKDKPEILRTFMPDNAGTRCIAVGFPGGFNTVFDSTQCRLSYSWSGNFLDVQPVWDGRGGNPAKLLGTKFWTSPNGFPWSLTDASGDPPDFGKQALDPAYGLPYKDEKDAKLYTGPMAVKFKGYSLDDDGKPTFKYEHTPDQGKSLLSVTEAPRATTSSVANGVSRQFAIDAPKGKAAWFDAATSSKEPKLLDADGKEVKYADSVPAAGVKVVAAGSGDAVQVIAVGKPPAGAEWRFVKDGAAWRVLLKLPEGKSTFAVDTWALPKAEPAFLKELK